MILKHAAQGRYNYSSRGITGWPSAHTIDDAFRAERHQLASQKPQKSVDWKVQRKPDIYVRLNLVLSPKSHDVKLHRKHLQQGFFIRDSL